MKAWVKWLYKHLVSFTAWYNVQCSMSEVEQLYQQCSELSEVVRPIKDVNRRHQQVSVWVLDIQDGDLFLPCHN